MIEIYSEVPDSVLMSLKTDHLEYCNVVNMCIKEAGCEQYQIPDQFEDFVAGVVGHIVVLDPELYSGDQDYYAYLTLKRMYVQPNSVGNREGWHIDGFLSDQKNFIWSDSDAMPTEVCRGKFTLTEDHEESLEEMLHQASSGFIEQLKTGRLYSMGQNCVHRPSRNDTNQAVLRTFVKLTYTRELFNGFGNAWNYKLPHIKPSKQRSDCRNHGVV